jgi:serine/threonine kinase 38
MTSTESPLRFSCHTLDKATKAKVTLENYYSNLISQHRERRERLRRLEESLQVTGYSYSISSASTERGGRGSGGWRRAYR